MPSNSANNPPISDPVPAVSVILCAYRPRPEFLNRVLASLCEQSLPRSSWEFILVDSASPEPLAGNPAIFQIPGARQVRALEPGLALARLLGFAASRAPRLAFVDDDTVLDRDYLRTALEFLEAHPRVGAVGGRIRPEFLAPAPPWFPEFAPLLALRDFGDQPLTATFTARKSGPPRYPNYAPIGPNVSDRGHFDRYVRSCRENPERLKFGRNGVSLASGEDNDYMIGILQGGGEVAYCPGMVITHIIPPERLEPAYLARLAHASSKTWVQVLALNGISPWPAIAPWSAAPRKLKAWLKIRPWTGPAARIRFANTCGHFDGRIRRPRAVLSTR